MPTPAFFQRLGICVLNNFLDADTCRTIQAEMRQPQSLEPAQITTDGIARVDEAIRRTKLIRVSDETQSLMQERLKNVKTQIEEYFQVALDECEQPQFLAYKEGDFFKVHTDSSTSSAADDTIRQRRVSTVLFLNGESSPPNETSYTGGSLVLYGLIKQPLWENYGFNIQGEPGLLIAFASDVYHEVMPVTQGMRCTMVTWFPAREEIDSTNTNNL